MPAAPAPSAADADLAHEHKPVFCGGLSMGALLALELGRSHPEIAGLLVLLYSLSGIGTFTTPNDDMAPTTLEGNFVVTWDSLINGSSAWDIFGQRFDADGVAQGSEFRVNTTFTSRPRRRLSAFPIAPCRVVAAAAPALFLYGIMNRRPQASKG